MNKFKMQLTWHNCLTYPPEEDHNDYLYITDGNRIYDVVYDVTFGWYNLLAHNYIKHEDLHKYWWADFNQTIQKTPEFKEALH